MYKDEMEQFLENRANQHRLYPSDHVWRKIQQQLHEDVRWPALPFILLFIIAALVVGTLLVKPEEHFFYRSHLLASKIPVTAKDSASNIQSLEESLATGAITQKTIAYATERLNMYATDASVISSKDSLQNISTTATVELLNQPVSSILPEAVFQAMPPASLENISIVADSYIDSMVIAHNTVAEHSVAPVEKSVKAAQNHTAMAAPVINQAASNDRWSFQLYVTPSQTYRRLVSGKNTKSAPGLDNAPIAPPATDDVNSVVKHTPANGFEIGFAIGYQLNKQFTIKAGLQYNSRKYNIEASTFNYERANVALSGMDTLTTYTPYRNLKGSYPVTLQNVYRELAIPVSISWKGWERKKLSWHVSASIQPTYILQNQAYIISTDYKNYVGGTSLARRWNINTSFETFISYRTGEITWQIGPQFRYQQLSTFKNQYPVREFLLDYGIKLGFSTPIK
ncbi:hypothetical protein FLA_6330 [Filimonas lacunae]|nr:hypothetical protein FLA_6330 [Filimonas lacunae]